MKGGGDYYAINPKGNVPALVLPGGVLLNEGAAVLQYIADQNPASKLAPAAGTIERYQLLNELNYVATDLHAAGYGPIFKAADDAEKAKARAALAKKLQYVNDVLLKGGKKHVVGNDLTIVDIYLYIVLGWSGYVGVDLQPFPNVRQFQESVALDPRVQEAQKKMKEISESK